MLEMRTSERSALKSCPQKWYWGSVEGLKPHRDANPLWFGTAVHEALSQWYIPGVKRGRNPVETFEEALSGNRSVIVTNEEEEAEYVDARALGIDMLTRYLEHYGEEEYKEYISSEYSGSVIIPKPKMKIFGKETEAKKRWLKYYMTCDGVYRDLRTGEIWLDEHKTAASIWDDMLPMDDQAGSYWAIIGTILRSRGVLPKSEEIAGINYNFLRKAMGDTRPKNSKGEYTNKPQKAHYIEALSEIFSANAEVYGNPDKMKLEDLAAIAEENGIEVLGEVSANQPPPYFARFEVYRSAAERKKMIKRIQEEAIFAEAYRSGNLPIVKSPSQNNCRSCPFRRMCELDEHSSAIEVEEFKEASFRVEDAYLPYRSR